MGASRGRYTLEKGSPVESPITEPTACSCSHASNCSCMGTEAEWVPLISDLGFFTMLGEGLSWSPGLRLLFGVALAAAPALRGAEGRLAAGEKTIKQLVATESVAT
jgi:hypothetical protein